MRSIDKWVGIPVCFIISPFRWLSDLFRSAKKNTPDISRTLFIELSEMGSAVIVDPAMRKLKSEGNAELYFAIFKKNYTMGASDNGTFIGFKVKVGDMVIKNQKAYSIRVGDRTNEPPFKEKGVITSLADVKEGDAISKGKILVNISEYIFNPGINVRAMGEIPGNPGKMFDIFVGRVDKGGLKVDVIEVRDPNPINPIRKESNEQKARKPLRFGSRLDVSTAGNWE